MELTIQFEENDKELIEALQQQFGHNIMENKSKNFDGLEILLTVVIPITALTIEIIDFILNNFWDREQKNCNNDKKRVIVEPDGTIDLRGYSEEEARRIIKCYFENQYGKKE